MMRPLLAAIRLATTVLALLLVAAATSAQAPEYGGLPPKKLIEYGWDVPSPDEVLASVRQMEERPFDGVIFRLRDYNHAFDTHKWPRAALESQMAQLEAIEWERFSDNFLTLYAANRDGMDWFDDDHWEAIQTNLRLTAEAARRGGCVGVVFDPEPYGPNPWLLSETAPGHDFASTAAQVRRRGAQFMNALQAELPTVRILSLYQLSVVSGMFEIADPVRIAAQLEGHHYGLLPAFIDGMLDVIGPQAMLIDGNEPAYYYEDEAPYAWAYQALTQGAQRLVTPANRATYRRQSQVGMAIYYDQVLGLRTPPQAFVAHYLTPQQRLDFLSHNVYWSLTTADEYAWFYSERANWWTGELVEGVDEAVALGRSRAQARQPLGFELDSLMAAAQHRMSEELKARVEIRAATVPRRGGSVLPPVIDGHFDDPAWSSAAQLAPFQGPATRYQALVATTTTRVLWDEDALYLAFDCTEPEADRIERRGQKRDDPIWAGDDLEVIIGVGDDDDYVHFIVNPDNVQWDGHSTPEGDDLSWDASWESAVTMSASGWSVELRLPWEALESEARGTRRVQLCRARAGNTELSCWSGVMRLFLETDRFGQWTFVP
jgi:hypothetical protein